MSDLFGSPSPKRRKANKTPRTGRTYEVKFLPHEFKPFKHPVLDRARYPVNPPKDGEKPNLGGEQKLVNWIFDNTNRDTLICRIDPDHFERLVGYIQNYKGGGPQQILRDSGIPALRRIGIELQPGWAAPKNP